VEQGREFPRPPGLEPKKAAAAKRKR
jgi:hypothetical protein